MSWLPKKNVIVPIDFSPESETAIRTALDLVESPDQVHVVHVAFPLDIVSPGVAWGADLEEDRGKATQEHAEEYLNEHQFTGVTLLTRVGDPGTEIADYATEVDADLIVIPSHGYHGIKRALLGSVAERVLRHAKCPVLVLHRADGD